MAKHKQGKDTRGRSGGQVTGDAGNKQEDTAGASDVGQAGSMQADTGSMQADTGSMQSDTGSMGGSAGGDTGSRQSALPDAGLPIQTGGERIGVGHHRQGRQTGGLHQPNIADELAAESAPDQGTPARDTKRKP